MSRKQDMAKLKRRLDWYYWQLELNHPTFSDEHDRYCDCQDCQDDIDESCYDDDDDYDDFYNDDIHDDVCREHQAKGGKCNCAMAVFTQPLCTPIDYDDDIPF